MLLTAVLRNLRLPIWNLSVLLLNLLDQVAAVKEVVNRLILRCIVAIFALVVRVILSMQVELL